MQEYDLVIIGGGPAGLAAAVEAKENGVDNILILDRESLLGGILNQCIHAGYSIESDNEDLTGPEFAERYIDKIKDYNIEYRLNTTVLEIKKEKTVIAVNNTEGIFEIKAKSIILALGAKERPKGSLSISGIRCAGVFTAGIVQKFINLGGILPGKEVVILGTGNIALRIASRLKLEGANVKLILEPKDTISSSREDLYKNLKDFNIPVLFNYSIVDVIGKERVEGITIAKVDEDKKFIEESIKHVSCDSIVLSVELYPDNEIIKNSKIPMNKVTYGPMVNEYMETEIKGIFACGAVVHSHDWIDSIIEESKLAAKQASLYIKHK